MPAGRARGIAAFVCGALGILLIFGAVLLGYATRSVFNEGAFSARVAASLEDPRFAGFVAEQIADAVIKAKPDLVGLRPVLVGVSRTVVSSPPFRAAVRRSARVMHHAILSGSGTNIVLNVQDLGVLLESMSETHPALANKIPPRLSTALARLQSLPGGERALQLARLANRLRAGAFGLLLLGIAFCAAAVGLASDRRHAIVRTGMALAVLGLVLALVARFGGQGASLLARHAENGPAIAGLAQAFLRGLMAWAAGLGFAGLVLAAAAASLLERIPLQRWGEDLGQWMIGPQPLMRYRFLRGVLGTALGGALLFWPLPTLTLAIWLCGLVIAFGGLREAFLAALHLLPGVEVRVQRAQRTAPHWGAIAVVSALAVLLLAGTTWLVLRSAAAPEAEEVTACNGSPLLCDRRLDQVMFPATHNSMGGAGLPGWMFPNQSADLPHQLADGIRAFLIDVHYGEPAGGNVLTDLTNETNATAKYEAAIGKEGMDAVLRIRDRLAKEQRGPRDVYMCHGFCELGATKLVPVLHAVRDFLVANPGEVLIFDIQDESVTPADIARCFQESGLVDFVYRGPARPPWPTLREMVETDQRVLVTAENHSEGVEWYHPQFETMQETPYEFKDPSQFSNRPNRGGTGGSLALLNHWIETVPMPKPSNAAVVNAHDALTARLRAFQKERGFLPNVVAVDFYREGDVVAVVRDYNARPWAAERIGPRSARVAAALSSPASP